MARRRQRHRIRPHSHRGNTPDPDGIAPSSSASAAQDIIAAAIAEGIWVADSIQDLARKVGGIDALLTLDDAPIPDEPFDWSTVADQDREYARRVLLAVDSYCDDRLDTEYRTIARRILARVAARDPRPLRRGSVATCAAGLVWLTLRANWGVGRGTRRQASMIWWWFGVSSCTERAFGLRKAAGLIPPADPGAEHRLWDNDLVLGAADLLHSHVRRSLVDLRTRYLEQAVCALAEREARRPFVSRGDGRMEARAQPTTPMLARKGVTDEGRAMIVVGFGESDADAKVFALSIPDAHELVAMLQGALATPIPAPSPR